MNRQFKNKEHGLVAQSSNKQQEKRQPWKPKSPSFMDKTRGMTATAAQECAYCHKPVPEGSVICPYCGHSLTPEICSFCGAAMKPSSKFCTHCGQPREGVVCPECGTLNARNFCRKCNAPLTDMGGLAQAAAQNDPAFKALQAKAKELAELHAQIEAFKNNREPEFHAPQLSETDRALLEEYAEILRSIGVSAPASTSPAHSQPAERPRYADTAISLDEIMAAYREKATEMNAALAAMVPPPDYTPEQQRDYYCARKIATIHTEYDMSDYQSCVWRCNVCGALHNSPSECVNPSLGGTWIYITPEQYIEENKAFIATKHTLIVE